MFYVIKENTVLLWICSRDCQSLSQVNKSFLLSKVKKAFLSTVCLHILYIFQLLMISTVHLGNRLV
jgi:hypothetical protein